MQQQNLPKIAIIGCGWLGAPLALHLHAQGYPVSGTSTTDAKCEKLRDAGIAMHLLSLPLNTKISEDLTNADYVIVDIPPFGEGNAYANGIRSLVQALKPKVKLLFVSSTGVYDHEAATGEITEDSPLATDKPRSLRTLQAEQETQAHPLSIILRAGGLMGYDRIPGKYYAGKPLPDPEAPVNYIHRDDLVRMISELLKASFPLGNTCFNAVAPEHPSKQAIVLKNCETGKWPLPQLSKNSASERKIIKSDKIVNYLDFSFLYPNPLDFLYDFSL